MSSSFERVDLCRWHPVGLSGMVLLLTRARCPRVSFVWAAHTIGGILQGSLAWSSGSPELSVPGYPLCELHTPCCCVWAVSAMGVLVCGVGLLKVDREVQPQLLQGWIPEEELL